jgi:hypothetical protein
VDGRPGLGFARADLTIRLPAALVRRIRTGG